MIWWCAVHHAEFDPERGYCLVYAVWFEAEPYEGGSIDITECEKVEALLIVKENGEWPKAAIEVLRYDVAALAEAGPRAILDALASVGGDSQ